MDDILVELLGVNSAGAFDFFLSGLREVTKRKPSDEMLYVASILAHYSQTSRYDEISMPVLANLMEVFEQFVVSGISDAEILEIGGSQILLFAGFFRDQMRKRYNVGWYDEVGRSFYGRAAFYAKQSKKARLFENMSDSFSEWSTHCCRLSRICRDNYNNRYILKI